MELVEILDNFFCYEHQTKIKDIINSELWHLSKEKNSIIKNNFDKPNNKFTNDNRDWPFGRIELENNLFFTSTLKYIIEEKMNKKKLSLHRVYAISQTYGENNSFHVDYDGYENNKFFTFCYYINENIDDYSDGYFYIKIPNEKMIMTVLPIDNRGIYFPSNYVHKGSSFSNKNINLRICITWKFKDFTPLKI